MTSPTCPIAAASPEVGTDGGDAEALAQAEPCEEKEPEKQEKVDKEEEQTEEKEDKEEGDKGHQEMETAIDAVDVDRPIPAVQICVRVRPVLQWERAEGYEASAMELKEGIDGTIALKEDGRHRHFRFNAVVGGERSQQEVWDMSRIDAVVKKVALGFHATVFAYGQTGTGKTHTMEGFTYEHHCGMAPNIAAARPRVKAGRLAEVCWVSSLPSKSDSIGFIQH